MNRQSLPRLEAPGNLVMGLFLGCLWGCSPAGPLTPAPDLRAPPAPDLRPPPDDLDYSIPDGDRQRDAGGFGDAGSYPLPDCAAVETPTASGIFTQIVKASCTNTGCHLGNGPGSTYFALATEQDLRTQWVGHYAQESLVKPRVAAGAPERSYVVDKILGKQGLVGTGGRMPLGCDPAGGCLGDDDVCRVINWIAGGAL